jgi:hypothetical protein
MIIDKELILTDDEVDVLFACLDFFIEDPPSHLNADVLDSLYGKVLAL